MPRSLRRRNQKQEKKQAVRVGGASLPAARSETQAVFCYGVAVADLAGFMFCVCSNSTDTCPSSWTLCGWLLELMMLYLCKPPCLQSNAFSHTTTFQAIVKNSPCKTAVK